MRLTNFNISIYLFLFPFLLASCASEDLDEIYSPVKEFWYEAPIFAQDSEVIFIQDEPIQMGKLDKFGRGLHDFSKNFTVTNKNGYTMAILTINFSDVFISTTPTIFINSRNVGSVYENSNISSSQDCSTALSQFYICPFETTINIFDHLKEGNNSFRIFLPGDMDTGFTFSDVLVELKIE